MVEVILFAESSSIILLSGEFLQIIRSNNSQIIVLQALSWDVADISHVNIYYI
jgi:hypothetical protein